MFLPKFTSRLNVVSSPFISIVDLQDVDDHLKEAQSRSKKSAEDAKEAVQSKLEKLQEAQSRSRKSAQVAKEAVQAKLEKLQEEKGRKKK